MIYGIGHDVLEIQRMSTLIHREGTGDRLVRRVLTDTEYKLAEQRGGRTAEFIAGRFAAKEAIVKALGCGIGRKVGFRDIEILPNAEGKPEVRLSDEAWARLDMPEGQAYTLHLTITHGRELASAFAVVETALR